MTHSSGRALPRAWFAVTALGVGSFSIVTAELAPIGLLSPIASELGVTTATAGLAVTLYAWIAVFAALASAVWLGAAPRRLMLVGLMLILGGSGICAGIADSFSWLMASRVLGALAHGAFWAMIGTLGAQLVPARQVGVATSIIFGGVSVASVLGVPLANFIGLESGWRAAFLAIGVLSIMVALALRLTIPNVAGSGRVGFSALGEILAIPSFQRIFVATLFAITAHFMAFTYIEPFLSDEIGMASGWIAPLLPHLPHPRTGQHAQPDDAGGALVLGRVQCLGQPLDLILRQKPLTRVLDAAIEAIGRVVVAPAPFDGKVEHLAQHLAHPVGAHRGGLAALQLAGAIVGLGLVRAGAALGDLRQQLLDIRLGDLAHQLAAPMRGDQFRQHGFLVGGIQGRQPHHMLGDIAVDQIGDAGRFAGLVAIRQRIATGIDLAAQLLGALARGRHRPFRPAREGHAALAAGMSVIKGEGPPAAAIDADGKATDIGIKNLVIPSPARLCVAQDLLGQADPVDCHRMPPCTWL